jgi:hypothetical protein
MPDNVTPGTIEHFVQSFVPENDELWLMAREVVGRITDEQRRFSKNKTAKAELYTYLAWQKEPDIRLGTAISSRYFQPGSLTALAFVAWFQRLRALAHD